MLGLMIGREGFRFGLAEFGLRELIIQWPRNVEVSSLALNRCV